jgi:hypothetical protein
MTAIADATVSGDRIVFAVEREAGGVKTRREFAGIAQGDRIVGTIESTDGTRVRTDRWEAVRDPGTKRPIEAGFQKSDHGW